MPRVGPNYTLPEPPFVPQTSISSAAMNSDLSDIADALTGSLARNGAGGMTASLPLANDGFIFQNDPDTGISRSAANTMSHECGGNEIMEVSPTGVDVTGALSATGAIKQNGFALLPVGLGPLPWSGVAAPSGWVLCYGQTLSRAAYPDLWAFAQTQIAASNPLYNNGDGSTTFGIADMRGRVAAGADNMGGVAAGRLTDAVAGIDSLGDAGGAQSRTLVTANLPPYTPSGTISGTVFSNQANVQLNSSSITPATGGSTTVPQISQGQVSINGSGFSFNGIAQGGTSTPVVTVQPTLVTNYIIFAGV